MNCENCKIDNCAICNYAKQGLKSCPFCGSENVYTELIASDCCAWFAVICKDCEASGPKHEYEDRDKAIEQWNKVTEDMEEAVSGNISKFIR